MNKYFSNITENNSWLSEANKILQESNFTKPFIQSFHTTWTVSGHRIREQINNDKTLTKLLWHILPRYSGKDILLFRGENKERWGNNEIGLCWTTNKETARMFGGGLNSIGCSSFKSTQKLIFP